MSTGRGPRAVDHARVDRRLERIEVTSDALAATASTPLADLLVNDDLVAATERRLQVAVQAAIDVAAHIAAASVWPTAEGYSAVFEPLSRHGVLDAELARRLAMAAGLRNLLVHDYLEVDIARLHASLAADVADLRAFVHAVVTWLAEPAPTPA